MNYIYYLLLIFPIFIFGQSSDQNYIKSTIYKQATATSITNPDIGQANVQINYFDGLGRPIQQIAHKQSNSGKNVIVHIEYDEFGRQVKEFLPYVSQTSDLDFDLGAQSNQLNYYSNSIDPNFERTSAPFSEKILDFSPLNKLLKQTAPGDAWKKDSGHEIKFDYDLNTLSDEVFNFSVNRTTGATDTYNYSLVCSGYYNPNTLYKNVIKDENWISGKNNTTEEYKNDLGKVILKRAYNDLQKHDTYYVYDNLGNLTYILPPLAVDNAVTIVSNNSNQYNNYNFFINYSDFLISCNNQPVISGGGGININLQGLSTSAYLFSGNINLGCNLAKIDTSKTFYINLPINVPNFDLLNFNGYTLYIENNTLKFRNNLSNPVCFTNLNSSFSGTHGGALPYQIVTTHNISIENNKLNNLGYQYKYDARNRLVEKKLPGKQWEFFVYDKLDRPVATGPAFSPYGDQSIGWLITQYDVFNRVVQTGWRAMPVTAATRNSNQTTINSGGNPFVLSANDVLTKNYYDNYTFPGAPNPLPALIENQVRATNVKGLQTGTWVKVLDNASSTLAETSYTLYDYKYRPVHNKTTNHLGGYTQVDTHLDWAGKTLYTQTKHKRTTADTELVVKDKFEYTPQDRLAVHKHQINNLPEELIAKNTYDELGQLTSKKVGGAYSASSSGLQTVDYSYNIRGWLKSINDVDTIDNDLFAFKINYNDAETATPLYNGNISETFWKTSSDNIKRKYNYKYDDLNRLLQADYSKQSSTEFNSYLEHLTYDKNGNIQTLLRNGDMDTDGMQFVNPIDNLTYLYDDSNKNQLLRVFDATANPIGFKDDTDGVDINQDMEQTPDYDYDANGNMIKDTNKQIQKITYNHLNLPTTILFVNNNSIFYLYNALGQKVQKSVDEIVNNQAIYNQTDYLAGFQYHNTVLKHFPHAEGYVNATQNTLIGGGTSYTFNYVYNYTDHLGNIRLSYSLDPSTNVLKIIEENHYYPFGLKHSGYNSDRMMYSKEGSVLKIKQMPPLFKTSYNKKFNGKSWETDLLLNIYDFHARGYMPDIVRTFQQDPLAEKFSNMSPYSFLNNNPLSFIDPNGMEAIPPIGFDQEDGAQHTDKDGSWVYNKSTNVWEGKNGAQSYDNMITLSELTINMPDRYEGTYFDKDNKGSGIYGPSTNGYLVAGICAVPLVVVAAEAGLIGAGCSYIYAEGSSLIANFSSSSYFSKAGIDFTTEIIANKGNIGDVNAISVIGAGFGADALSSPFSLSYNRGFERKSLEQTVINYGANKFNGGMQSGVKYLGTNSIFKSGFGQVYTNALSIGVQSVIKNQTSELIDKPNE